MDLCGILFYLSIFVVIFLSCKILCKQESEGFTNSQVLQGTLENSWKIYIESLEEYIRNPADSNKVSSSIRSFLLVLKSDEEYYSQDKLDFIERNLAKSFFDQIQYINTKNYQDLIIAKNAMMIANKTIYQDLHNFKVLADLFNQYTDELFKFIDYVSTAKTRTTNEVTNQRNIVFSIVSRLSTTLTVGLKYLSRTDKSKINRVYNHDTFANKLVNSFTDLTSSYIMYLNSRDNVPILFNSLRISDAITEYIGIPDTKIINFLKDLETNFVNMYNGAEYKSIPVEGILNAQGNSKLLEYQLALYAILVNHRSDKLGELLVSIGNLKKLSSIVATLCASAHAATRGAAPGPQ